MKDFIGLRLALGLRVGVKNKGKQDSSNFFTLWFATLGVAALGNAVTAFLREVRRRSSSTGVGVSREGVYPRLQSCGWEGLSRAYRAPLQAPRPGFPLALAAKCRPR